MKKGKIVLIKETNGMIHQKTYDSELYIIKIVDFEGRSVEMIPKHPLMPSIKMLNEHIDISMPAGHQRELIPLYQKHFQEVEELIEVVKEL